MVILRLHSSGFGAVMLMLLGTLSCPAQTALVRHAPTLNGPIEGSVQQMTAENVTFNGGGVITGDLLVPGSPTVRLNGTPVFGGTIVGTGNATPANYQVTLNGGARLGHLRTRTDAVSLPVVNTPPQPGGARSVSINNSGQSPGDFATIRNLTLNGNVGQVSVPPGTYGGFVANGNSGFTLGVAGAFTPAIYNFQNLTLNGNSALQVAGPVIVTLNGGFSINGSMGAAAHSEWLKLRIAGGGLTLNGNVSFYGQVEAPAGTITLNGNSQLVGGVVSDRLIINGNGLLRLIAAAAHNQPPTVTLISPLNGASIPVSTPITLTATADDADGAVAGVEFYDGETKVGTGGLVAASSYRLQLPVGLVTGPHILSARATDNLGAITSSATIAITVTQPLNRPPLVTLKAPSNGSIYGAGSAVNLTATATDPDGSIGRVEFYQDGEWVGTVAAPSAPPSDYVFSHQTPTVAGAHVLKARAYDDTGAFTDSLLVTFTVVAGLPYTADFEANKGYQLASLHGQQGWKVLQGGAEVTAIAAFQGAQAVEMKSGAVNAIVRQTFASAASPEATFVDLFVHPVAGTVPTAGSVFDFGGATVGFVRDGAMGQMKALQGDAGGSGIWQPAGPLVALDAGGLATRWVRLTARLSYPTLTWDLYIDGQLVLFDLSFSYTGQPPVRLTALTAQGAATQASHFDFLYAGYDNPLFADADRDGMDDVWESANGLNPNLNDRNEDKDHDGLLNLREYQLGNRADRDDTDGDGLPDGWEVQYHLDPLHALPGGEDSDHDGLGDFQEFTLGTNPLAADTDSDGIPDSWEAAHGLNPVGSDAAFDADGDGVSNLEEYRNGTDPQDFFNGAHPQTGALNGGGAGPGDELSMIVRKPDGTPWPNAPARFQITTGTRRISARQGGLGYSTVVEVRADANGVARVYLEPLQP